MPILLAVLTALVGGYFWYLRAQRARDAAEMLADATSDVRNAARRFGFRRKANIHPTESVDDPRLAALSIVAAMAQMDTPWSTDLSRKLTIEAQRAFEVSVGEAEEMTVFAKWMSDQSATYAEVVRRLAKQLARLGGVDTRKTLAEMIGSVCTRGDGDLSEDVTDALATVNRHLA
ncbi:MAG: hypothetical protein AAGA87_12480 [Pseudomonadota bacterium]